MNIEPDPIHRQKLYRPAPGLAPRWRWWALALLFGAAFLLTCGGLLLRLVTQ